MRARAGSLGAVCCGEVAVCFIGAGVGGFGAIRETAPLAGVPAPVPLTAGAAATLFSSDLLIHTGQGLWGHEGPDVALPQLLQGVREEAGPAPAGRPVVAQLGPVASGVQPVLEDVVGVGAAISAGTGVVLLYHGEGWESVMGDQGQNSGG